MTSKTVTNFDRSLQATNLVTVADWRVLGASLGLTWRGAMNYMAAKRGGAFVMEADGSLFVVTQVTGRRNRQRRYAPGTWQFVQYNGDKTTVCGAVSSAVSTGAPYVEPVLACGHQGNVFACDTCVAWRSL